MKSLIKILWLLPLLALLTELIVNMSIQTKPTINPTSTKNDYIEQLSILLISAKITPLSLNIHSYDNEIEFFVKDKPNHTYKVIISSSKNMISQVNALQKLIKIANIKGKEIQFIDLGPFRPYATL